MPPEAVPPEAMPPEHMPPEHMPPPVDAVRARRQVVAKWTKLANRVGYLLFLLAIVTFMLGFFFGFSGTVATIVTVSMVIGSILLAPALVLGYAVKAAERDDRERGF